MKLSEMRKLASKATPGPWEFGLRYGMRCSDSFNADGEKLLVCGDMLYRDGKLVEAMRNNIEKLLDVAEAAKDTQDFLLSEFGRGYSVLDDALAELERE
jgi:hypothetical protein